MSRKEKNNLIRIAVCVAAFLVVLITDKTLDGGLAGAVGGRYGWLLPFALYLVIYLAIGYGVLWRAARNILHGQMLDENFLMCIATLGAFALAIYTGASGQDIEGFDEACAVLLYLDDFAGGLCRPVVAEGQTVRLGDPVGVSDGGAWVHASVSGTVRAVRAGALIVENDFRSTPGRSVEPLSSLEGVAREPVLRRLSRAGLLTADGAPLPEKLQPCHALALTVLTEAEAAVYFALLHQVLGGVRAMGRLVQPRKLLLFYDRRFRPVEKAARRLQFPVEAVAVDGAAPELDQRLTGRRLDAGVTWGNLGCLVFSPREAAALFAAIYLGQPYVQQAVAISGPGRQEWTVRMAPLGTSAAHLLAAAHRTAPTVLLGDAATGRILRRPDTALGKRDGLLTCLTGRTLTPAGPG